MSEILYTALHFGLKIQQCFKGWICLYLLVEGGKERMYAGGPIRTSLNPQTYPSEHGGRSSLQNIVVLYFQMMDYIENIRHDKEQTYCALFQHSAQLSKNELH